MPSFSNASTAVVIDAGVGASLVLNLVHSPVTRAAWQRWLESGVDILAPTLWHDETISTIRKSIAAGLISEADSIAALDALISLDVQIVSADADLLRGALRWAARLNQRVAYDSAYLALAERAGLAFWSADRRLVNGARQAGATWVHWIGEAAEPLPEA
jgi:predicted nucleic acid-binding protein